MNHELIGQNSNLEEVKTFMSNESLENSLIHVRSKCSIEITKFPIRDWLLEKGSLKNSKSNYFYLSEFEDQNKERHLLIEQNEPALVGLLMCQVDGTKYFALNSRFEPGLHQQVQLTCTVQSTPSNYLQTHGGGPTPYLEHFLPLSPSEKIKARHFSKQFDWGEYYLNKVKIFVLVEVDSKFDLIQNYHWVTEMQLIHLLTRDFLVTTDLRAMSVIALGLKGELPIVEIKSDDYKFSNRLSSLNHLTQVNLELDHWDINEKNERGIVFVKSKSLTREVNYWEQPLVKLKESKEIRLFYTFLNSEIYLASQFLTQLGLNLNKLVFPAELHGIGSLDNSGMTVHGSAEGGRFFRHQINIHLIKVDSIVKSKDVEWISLDTAEILCAKPLTTSLEFRLAVSMLKQIK